MIYITAQKEVKRSIEDAYTGRGPPPIGALLFMASAAHGFFKGVNLIDHVSLEDRLRVQGYGWVWLGGNTSCTEGNHVR